jgi:SSS family solute:Na+ symporter
MSAARRTPIIAAYPKIFIPALTIIPGLIALVEFPKLGAESGDYQYNNAVPLLMNEYLPNGMLGIAITGLMASFMAGVAANVSAFNTVITTDLVEPYIKKGRSDDYYVRFGRIATLAGIAVSISTALIASTYENLMNYLQALFSIFNAPLFATFIIGMFWKRMTAAAGIAGLVAGTVAAAFVFVTSESGVDSFGFEEPLLFTFGSSLAASFWGAVVAFVADAVVSVGVSLVTRPKAASDLQGLVYGSAVDAYDVADRERVWWRNPLPLGIGALALSFALYIPFA